MNWPGKYIKVFGSYYKLVPIEGYQKESDNWGEYDPVNGSIKYDPSDGVAKTILHEMIHAFRDGLSLFGSGGDKEERATEKVQTALFAAIMDNIDFCQWVLDEFRRLKQEIEGNK